MRPDGQGWPDCDPDIRQWLTTTEASLAAELGERRFVGSYLHGSLAAGSFRRPKSDFDVLFVVRERLTDEVRSSFLRSCASASRTCPTLGGLECSVILERHAVEATHPMPYEAHFGPELLDAIVRGEIRWPAGAVDPDLAAHAQSVLECGHALSGRPKESVFGPVPRAAFLDSVERDLAWILEGEHLLQSPVYGVLNSCRVLWVWSGESDRLVPTKVEAGEWAIDRVPASLRETVRRSLDAYRDTSEIRSTERERAGYHWDRDALIEFRDFMRDRWRSRLGPEAREG